MSKLMFSLGKPKIIQFKFLKWDKNKLVQDKKPQKNKSQYSRKSMYENFPAMSHDLVYSCSFITSHKRVPKNDKVIQSSPIPL